MRKLPRLTNENIRAAIVILFLGDIMLVYPFLNSIEQYYALNRIAIIFLILAVLLSNLKHTIMEMTSPRDNISILILAYLFYILISLQIYSVNANMSLQGMFPFFINAIFPIIFYFTFLDYPRRNVIIITVLIAMLINILFGLLCYPLFGVQELAQIFMSGSNIEAMQGSTPWRLSSLVGTSSILGFLSQLGFAYTLFYHRGKYKTSLLALFLLPVILCLQRGAWMAIFVTLTFYLFDRRTPLRTKLLIYFISGGLIVGMVLIFAQSTEYQRLGQLVLDRVEDLNYSQAMEGRAFQQIIFNTDNVFCILFGEGYGKYSPLNTMDNFQQPDAPYYMIYNETGIIGFILFCSMFLSVIFKALRYRNFFLVSFVVSLFVYFLGTRIMWYFPTNYMIFITMAILGNDKIVQSAAKHSTCSGIGPVAGNSCPLPRLSR